MNDVIETRPAMLAMGQALMERHPGTDLVVASATWDSLHQRWDLVVIPRAFQVVVEIVTARR